MAAIGVHVVDIVMVPISPVGGVVVKNTSSIGQVVAASTEMRVLPDATIPNSAGYPTIKAFIAAEAASGYKVAVINQSMIILYNG